MYFLVTHRWEPADDTAASQRLLAILSATPYRAERGEWPRLQTLWQNPREREVIACWESPDRARLTRFFARERAFTTRITHVRQLYPPHVQGYNAMVIRADPSWKPGLK